jgi:uncharacterized membrane protein YsdA (DUF1294 family)
MSAKKYVRRNIYRWHRITSLIIALPILLWSLSGFLYPVMTSFKPDVRNQFLPAASIDTNRIHVSLHQALQQNNITILHNFRIVKLDSNYYYQIQQNNSDTLTYLSCDDGVSLKDGDQLYACYLAQRYLSEAVTKNKQKAMGHQMAADISIVTMMFTTTKSYNKTKITNVELIKEFNKEYKTSNALLPVYKISFDRADGIRLYIETSTDRLATAVDNKKAWFINFFAITHTWSFLDGMGQAKNLTLGAFSLLCFISSLLGFYVYNIVGKKKAASASKSWHRTLGNVFVLATALYGASGAWHAFHKLSEKPGREITADRSQFSADEVSFSFPNLAKSAKENEKLTNVSIVKMNGENYWQLYLSKEKGKQKTYINTKTFEELADGDIKYGCFLACLFSNKTSHTITHSKCLDQFTNNYSMMNKRLPVIEVGFDASENYYVETSTGHLSAVTNSYDKAERFSFSNLHMHHYWEDWFGDKGKTIQKIVFISTTLGLLLLALTGCWMYWRKRQKALK